jgi:hypothetical protein
MSRQHAFDGDTYFCTGCCVPAEAIEDGIVGRECNGSQTWDEYKRAKRARLSVPTVQSAQTITIQLTRAELARRCAEMALDEVTTVPFIAPSDELVKMLKFLRTQLI